MMSFPTDDILSVFAAVSGSSNGLSSEEASKRLKENGRNRLNPEIKASFGYKFTAQLLDPNISLLLAISAISAVSYIISNEYPYEFMAIFAIIVINALVIVLQRSKSDRLLHNLKSKTAPECTVLRDGEKTVIKSEDIVVGDVVYLCAGSVVPADCRVFKSSDLVVEESAVTGSRARKINKYSSRILGITDRELDTKDMNNMVFMKSTVVSGEGYAVVTATGLSTCIGKTFDIVSTARKNKTPLQLKLHDANNWLNIIVMCVCGVVLLVQLIMTKISGGTLGFVDTMDSIMVTLALSITAMPQGLAAFTGTVISFTLSALYDKKIIVSKTSSMEMLCGAKVFAADLTRIEGFELSQLEDFAVKCRNARIIPVIMTDKPVDGIEKTAYECGLAERRSRFITGEELEKLTEEEIEKQFMEFRIFSCITDEQKNMIISKWEEDGYPVAVTGNGVSDVLAMKNASVSIATDISEEDAKHRSQNITVKENHFGSFLECISASRRIYGNVQKFFIFILSSSLAELLTILLAAVLNFNILDAVHLLWISLVADSFPSMALCLDKGEKDLMDRRGTDPRDNIYSHGVWQDVVFHGIIITLLTLGAYFVGEVFQTGVWRFAWVTDENGAVGTTMAFITMVLCELFNAFNMRSRAHSVFTMEKKENRNLQLYGAMGIVLVLTTAAIQIPLISGIFGFTTVTWLQYSVSVLLSVIIIPASEIRKFVKRLANKKKSLVTHHNV